MNMELTSMSKTFPRMEKTPRTNTTSWTKASIALMPYRYDLGTRRNAYQTYKSINTDAASTE